MGVYVKQMEMPLACSECPLCLVGVEKTTVCIPTAKPISHQIFNRTRLDVCPLVRIETPHGRLIDATVFNVKYVRKYGERVRGLDDETVILGAEIE